MKSNFPSAFSSGKRLLLSNRFVDKIESARRHTMNKIDLKYRLNKIGMGVFVQYFREFGDFKISNQEVIALLPSEYTFKSRTSRTSKSRRIFREGLEVEALTIITESDRVDRKILDDASALLTQLRNRHI